MNFILLHTTGGTKYAREIGQKLRDIFNCSYFLSSVKYYPKVHERHPELNANNTIIHSRAAHPTTNPRWVKSLIDKERNGWKVINNTNTLALTSDKLKCSLLFNEMGLPHPLTISGSKRNRDWLNRLDANKEYIIKPFISQGQGKFVQKFKGKPADDIINQIPTNSLVIQEFINVVAIHRIICLNGTPLGFSFVDKGNNKDWKVSVCLNKTSMKYNKSPDRELLNLAAKAQRAVNGIINFVDVFETKDGYSISEINTACNLLIHEELSKVRLSVLIADTLYRIGLRKELGYND